MVTLPRVRVRTLSSGVELNLPEPTPTPITVIRRIRVRKRVSMDWVIFDKQDMLVIKTKQFYASAKKEADRCNERVGFGKYIVLPEKTAAIYLPAP